jgi:hypothetical protein
MEQRLSDQAGYADVAGGAARGLTLVERKAVA